MATGEDKGKPLIIRIRSKSPSFAQKEVFPCLLAVTWQFDPLDESGMPSAIVVDSMNQFEDLLVPAFENSHQAFLSVIVTGNGVREWQWYARDAEEVMKLVNEALHRYDPFPVQFSFQDDPEWKGYSQFLEIIG